ncbi:MAG: alpha-amylase family glycosyl hydrolase, partial [Lachnospiraceae bacterium]|nr:alpha-amylase family glycosyl hydrolase [Lachnospiraceae bacterium]
MKRRILSLLLVACMAIGLCACGSDKKGEKTAQTEGKGEDNVIGINPEWAETTVFYEIFVRSFADSNGDGIGDFKGIEENLDYLKELGIGAIWLMPMMEST